MRVIIDASELRRASACARQGTPYLSIPGARGALSRGLLVGDNLMCSRCC